MGLTSLNKVYYYAQAKWKGEPRESKPLCVKCNSENLRCDRTYPVVTECYKDYTCLDCGQKFTIDWS